MSFAQIKPDNIILTCLKKSEKGSGIILRFFETEGKKTQAEINLFKCPKKVELVNLLEKKEKDMDPENKKIRVEVKPFEIVSLRIEF